MEWLHILLPNTQCTGLALGTLPRASGYGSYKQVDNPESLYQHFPILYKWKCLNPDFFIQIKNKAVAHVYPGYRKKFKNDIFLHPSFRSCFGNGWFYNSGCSAATDLQIRIWRGEWMVIHIREIIYYNQSWTDCIFPKTEVNQKLSTANQIHTILNVQHFL